MAQLNLSLPSFQGLDLSDEKQLRKLTSYLYRLDEQLRYVLNNLGEENLSDSLRAIINAQTDATVLDEMTGQVQRLSTQIVQTAQAISLKADKETLDALGETLGSSIAALEVTAEQIRTEVSDTASGLQSQINQQAGQISLRVTKTEYEEGLDGKLDADAPSVGVVTSGVVITEDQVKITSPETVIAVPSEDGEAMAAQFDADGLTARKITCPNVAPMYDGPANIMVNPAYTSAELNAAPGARYRSLKDALAALSGRYVSYSVNVTLAAGAVDYGDATLHGCVAPYGIGIWGQSASNRSAVNGKVTITQCVGPIDFGYIDVNSAANTDGIFIDGSAMVVHVGNCNFSGSGGSAVSTNAGANVQVYNTSMRGYSYSIYAYMMSTVYSSGNSGNCDIAADCSIVYGSGYQPSSTSTLAPAEIRGGMFRNGGCSVNQGSGSSSSVTLTTATYPATSTGSYKGSGSKYRNEVGQGWWSGIGRIRGCMWFDNSTIRSALSGRTIRSATLRLAMRSGVGRGASVTVELCGTAASSGASSAAVTKSYGVIGTTSPGEVTTITIPNEAITDLRSGTINGLMLYSSDTGAYKDRDYSKNYAIFDGASDGTPPMLTVVYS